MANRRFSMMDYFNRIAEEHKPLLSFRGKTKADWTAWRKKAYAKYVELLGPFPKPGPLAAETVAAVEENGVIKERVVFDSEEGMSVPCIVCRPKNLPKNKKARAIVCSHGHGAPVPYAGKRYVAGANTVSSIRAETAELNYNYGEQMAQRGFLTIAPDLRVFGERRDGEFPGRDLCNVHFIRGALLGIYTLTLNLFDFSRCVDYLETRPEVDPKRIGLMGLSQGGTIATFAGALDPRFKVVDIICYLITWKEFAVKNSNFCGSQFVPGIFRYFDTHDIASLIAPRPLLVEYGFWDHGFTIDAAMPSYRQVEKVYRAAGVADRTEVEIGPNDHAFCGGKAFAFFDKWL